MSHLPKILRNPASRLVKVSRGTFATIESVGGSYILYFEGKILGEICKLSTSWWGAKPWANGRSLPTLAVYRKSARQSAIEWLYGLHKGDIAAMGDLNADDRAALSQAGAA
jgi:hypothetical protein